MFDFISFLFMELNLIYFQEINADPIPDELCIFKLNKPDFGKCEFLIINEKILKYIFAPLSIYRNIYYLVSSLNLSRGLKK